MDCSANATPEFEGRGGEALATEMSRTLAHAYNDQKVFDLKTLSILSGKHCWLLYVDILVNNNDTWFARVFLRFSRKKEKIVEKLCFSDSFSSLHWIISLSFCSFLYKGVC